MTRSRTWTLGTALVVLAVFAVGWFLVISPKKATAADLKTSAAATIVQNQGVEAKVRELKLQQKALPAQQAQIAAIQQQLPSQAQLPSLLREVSNVADDANVGLSGISPGALAPVPQDTGVAFIPVVITASGSFTQLKQFLFGLEENKRSVLVTGFTIGKADAVAGSTVQLDPNTLAITIQSRVFVTAPSAVPTGSTVTPTAGATAPATTPPTSGASATPTSTPTAAPSATKAN